MELKIVSVVSHEHSLRIFAMPMKIVMEMALIVQGIVAVASVDLNGSMVKSSRRGDIGDYADDGQDYRTFDYALSILVRT